MNLRNLAFDFMDVENLEVKANKGRILNHHE